LPAKDRRRHLPSRHAASVRQVRLAGCVARVPVVWDDQRGPGFFCLVV